MSAVAPATGIQPGMPMQLPLQPVNIEPLPGVVEREKEVPAGNSLKQMRPQLMPEGSDVTVPSPTTFILSETGGADDETPCTNVAVSSVAPVTGMQPGMPMQLPLQPWNAQPEAGVVVREMPLPAGKLAEQIVPQLIPGGTVVTVPCPTFAIVTVKVVGAGGGGGGTGAGVGVGAGGGVGVGVGVGGGVGAGAGVGVIN